MTREYYILGQQVNETTAQEYYMLGIQRSDNQVSLNGSIVGVVVLSGSLSVETIRFCAGQIVAQSTVSGTILRASGKLLSFAVYIYTGYSSDAYIYTGYSSDGYIYTGYSSDGYVLQNKPSDVFVTQNQSEDV